MKSKLLIVALTFTVIAACKKDQFTTKPQLKFISTNSTVFVPGQEMLFDMEFTDKEGDINKGTMYVEEVTNDPLCPDNNAVNKGHYTIPPDFINSVNSSGTISIRYTYGTTDGQYPIFSGPQCGRNDTCVLRFALTDEANNTSDTIVSPQLVFIK